MSTLNLPLVAPDAVQKPFPLTTRMTVPDTLCERYGLEKLPFTLESRCEDYDQYVEIMGYGATHDPDFQSVWQEAADRLVDPANMNGTLWIAREFRLLIVTGDERGKVWEAAIGCDLGIFPFILADNPNEHLDFLDWYEYLLEESLSELAEQRTKHVQRLRH